MLYSPSFDILQKSVFYIAREWHLGNLSIIVPNMTKRGGELLGGFHAE
jgi:hypothetical protein